MKRKTLVILLSTFYGTISMASAIYLSYISLYYAESGLNNSQIGTISAVVAGITMISQMSIGSITDKAAVKNKVVQWMVALSALTIWLVPLAGRNFLMIMASVTVFSIFHNAINPLNDTIVLDLARREGFKFSWIRMSASLGYAIMAAIAGIIFSNNIWYIFPALFSLRIISFVISFFIPPVRNVRKRFEKSSFTELLKDKSLLVIYIYVFVLSSTFGFLMSFHAIYSRQLGISTGIIGIGIMIGSLSQFPFMAFFERIKSKLGLLNILLLSGTVFGIRYLIYATSLSKGTLILAWFLHGFNYILLYLCLLDYVNSRVRPELQARGQMANFIVISGISSVSGGYFGGMFSTAFGLKTVFMGCAVICFLAVMTFYVATRVFHFTIAKE